MAKKWYKKIMAEAVTAAILIGCVNPLALRVSAQDDIMRVFYVSPDGGGDGTEESPLSSIVEARDAIRDINGDMTGDIVVYILDGTYEIDSTIEFGVEDSGTNGYNIRYEAAPGAHPIISGGKRINGTWTSEGNGIYSIPFERDKKLRSLYVNGNRASMTSKEATGKGGYNSYTVTPSDGDWVWESNEGKDAYKAYEGTILDMDETLINTRNSDDIEIESRMTWNTAFVGVDNFKDLGDGTMAAILQQPYGTIAQSLWGDCRYGMSKPQIIHNVFEWLDEPGEFYFDKTEGKLYYYPREDESLESADVVVPQLEKLITLNGNSTSERVHNISFNGIDFAYTDWNLYEINGSCGRVGVQGETIMTAALFAHFHPSIYRGFDVGPSAVEANNAAYLSFTSNIFRNTGNNGLGLVNDVTDVTIDGNRIYDTGGCGMLIGHPQHVYIGDKGSERGEFSDKEKYDVGVEGSCQRIDMTNNYIYDPCKLFWGGSAVMAFVISDSTIKYNHIEEVPYAGLSVGWGWWNMNGSANSVVPGEPYSTTHDNTITNNVFINSVRKLEDTGAIYTLGDMPGTTISENFINGIGAEGKTPGRLVRGIHPDEGSRHIYGEKNVIQIPTGNVAIDCCRWNEKGYNRWDNNYSTSSKYNSNLDGTYEPETIITNKHTFPDAYWDKTVFNIIRNAGIRSGNFKDLPSRIKIQDQLLPVKFKLDPGEVLDLCIDPDDIDGDIWLAPEGTTSFTEGDSASKAVNGQITVPTASNTYKLYIVNDSDISEPSKGEINLNLVSNIEPSETKLVSDTDGFGGTLYAKYDLNSVDWCKIARIMLKGSGELKTNETSNFSVYILKNDVDFSTLDNSQNSFADSVNYVTSSDITSLEFDFNEDITTLASLMENNTSSDGTVALAIVCSDNEKIYSSSENGYPTLNFVTDSEYESDDNPVDGKLLFAMDFDNEDMSTITGRAAANGVLTYKEGHSGKAVYFDGDASNYIELFDSNGGSLLAGLDRFTISYWSKTDNHTPNWVFFAAPNSNPITLRRESYFGVYDTGSRLWIERFLNGRPSSNPETNYTSGEWNHIVITAGKDSTSIYVNGEKLSFVTSDYAIKDIMGSSPIAYLGRANWGGGESCMGLFDDVRIYSYATTEREVKKLYNGEVLVADSNVIEKEFTLKVTDGDYTATLPDGENLTLYVAGYTSDGTLIGVNTTETGSFSNAAYVKAFLWDADTMKPVSDALRVSNTIKISLMNSEGKLLSVENASVSNLAKIVQDDNNGENYQIWRLVPTDDGYYNFYNTESEKVMAVNGGSTNDGATVIQWTREDGDDQRWVLVPVTVDDKTYYWVKNKKSGKCLTINSNGEAEIQQYMEDANQLWELTMISGELL